MLSDHAAPTTGLNVAKVFGEQPLGWVQIRVVLLCACLVFLESFDSATLGYVAPTLGRVWHLAPGALGPIFAIGFFGQLIGAVVAGSVADRTGRRGVLVTAALIFGLGALATTRAGSLSDLMWLRLATGTGLGAALPIAVALATEFSPVARRSPMLVVLFAGITLGSAACGLVATRLVPLFGWQSVFLVAGALPLMLVPVLILFLPESPSILALRGGRDAEIAALLHRINRSWRPPNADRLHFAAHMEAGGGLTVRHLFRRGRGPATLLLWLIAFMNGFEIYVFASWLPSVAHAAGLTEEASILTGVAMTLGGFAGTLSMGWLLDRYPIEWMMAVNYAAAALFIVLLALTGDNAVLMMAISFAAGLCIVGGQTGANALIAYRHPAALRATALAWALAAGRVASIIGPWAAGIIISLGWSTRSTFLSAVAPALCASVAVLCYGLRAGSRDPDPDA